MDIVFNQALGEFITMAQKDNLYILLLQEVEVDATLRLHPNLQVLLADPANTEANFDNYSRQPLTSVAIGFNVNERIVDADDVSYNAAGGTTDNDVVKAIVYDNVGPDNDALSVPMFAFDAVFTTNGGNVTLQVNAGGLAGAVSQN